MRSAESVDVAAPQEAHDAVTQQIDEPHVVSAVYRRGAFDDNRIGEAVSTTVDPQGDFVIVDEDKIRHAVPVDIAEQDTRASYPHRRRGECCIRMRFPKRP